MVVEKYSIFDEMIEGIQVINPKWEYAYINETVVTHGKIPREELLGKTMMEKYPGIEKTEMFLKLQECMQTRKSYHMVNEFDFPDGSKGYFELRMQAVHEGVLIMSFDVTDQKRAEAYLKNINVILDEKISMRTHELELKNREMEQFTYIASHDLQEPLRTITNYIDAFKEDYGTNLDETAKKYLNAIDKASVRMSRLTKALLEFSRLGQKRELKKVNIATLIANTIEALHHQVKNSGAIIEVGEMPVINAYETELAQLFQNLISNAIKFGKKNLTPRIKIYAELKSGSYVFSVTDNGIGIEEKYYERIFHIFQRLHLSETYEGTGIGLTFCKKIIELHAGEISVSSEPGIGSTFTFSIPNL